MDPSLPQRPRRSDPVPSPKHPPELQWLLRPVRDNSELREAMVRAYYGEMEGASNSVSVQQATLLSGVYGAILQDLEDAAKVLPEQFKASAAEEARTIRQELREQGEQARKAEQTERDKHRELLRSGIDENNRAYAKAHGERTSVRTQVLMACGVTALVASALTVAAMNRFVVEPVRQQAEERLDAAQQASDGRYWKLFGTLPAAAKLMADLQWEDGTLRILQADGRATGLVLGMGRLKVDSPRYAPDKNEITVPLATPSPASKPKAAPTALVKGS